MNDPFGIEKGYGLGRYYARELAPVGRAAKKVGGKLKPLPKRVKVENKHKKPLQLGF
jgi:hypothetical protein